MTGRDNNVREVQPVRRHYLSVPLEWTVEAILKFGAEPNATGLPVRRAVQRQNPPELFSESPDLIPMTSLKH